MNLLKNKILHNRLFFLVFPFIVVSCGDGTGAYSTDNLLLTMPDPLFSQQWYLQNTSQNAFSKSGGTSGSDINFRSTISQGITGAGVNVLVSDDGMDVNHEDLADNYDSSRSRNYTLASPFIGDGVHISGFDGHGTSVSGIIGAVSNNIGIRGVAAKAKLSSANYLSSGVTQTRLIEVDQANTTADIVNQSWGVTQIFINPINSTYLTQLKFSIQSGRLSKGTLFVKSAGNDYDVYNPSNGINYHGTGNANFDGDNTTPYTIIVAALNSTDNHSSYSSPGSNIWISGYGGEYGNDAPAIVTVDRTGCTFGKSSSYADTDFDLGLDSANTNCNYTNSMNGTSSAAPVISGVVALLLEANPKLSWRDVKHILASTATQVNSTIGNISNPNEGSPSGHVWEQGWVTNAAGYKFHNWFGFGKVNVDAAVEMAKTYTVNLGNILSTTDTADNWKYDSGTISKSIPDNSAVGTSSTIAVQNDYIIEEVQIKISSTHTWVGDVGIELTSPSGTKSILKNINDAIWNNSILNDSIFMSNAFYGESSKGNWTIKVIDGSPRVTGTLTNWKINVIGHKNPNSVDKTSPNPITNLTHASAYNSSSSSPPISWNASTSIDVQRYEYSIGSTVGSSNILGWTSANLFTTVNAYGLTLVPNQKYYVNVRVVDFSENISSVVSSSGWLYSTAAAPTISISAASVIKMNSTGNSYYTITYSGANSVTLSSSDITLNQSGVSCTKSLTGSGTTTRTLSLSACTGNGTVTISIAANTATNSIGYHANAYGPSSAILIDNTVPTISGLSNDTSTVRSKTWNWGCNESDCSYRFLVDNVSVSTPIGSFSTTSTVTQSTGTGTYYLHVQAQDGAGNLSAVTHVSSLINNTVTISGISNDSSAKKSKTWNWGCNFSPCTYRFLVDNVVISNPSGSFTPTATATQSTGSGTYYLHVQAQDALGFQSAVTHVSAVLDNTAPTITGLTNDTVWTKSKTWNWGCSKASCTYKYVVDTSATTTPSNTLGSTVTATQSSGTGTYYLHVLAQDSLGNQSGVVHVSALIDNTVPTTPVVTLSASSSASLTTSPTVTWTASTDANSGLDRYQTRVYQNSNSSLIQDWTNIISGNSATSLSLTGNVVYRLELSSLDLAGNRSLVSSSTWTPVTAPSSLTYSTNPASYTVGTAITNNSPTSSGGTVVSYSISPSLPSGLTLNTTTGVISGTPTIASYASNYTVTATNIAGSTTRSVSINVSGWAAMSTTNAPTGRTMHTAVWTGSEMIVWGGYTSSRTNTGAKYNPSTDTWTSTSLTNAPSARYLHTALWTGSKMIIWGGYGNGRLNDGGIYDPTANTWTSISTINAPSARSTHTAVWTGSKMIVWGGCNNSGSYVNDGGIYDPSNDTWTTVSITSAPSARNMHTAIWTGSKMIVWGGYNGSNNGNNDGGIYDPSNDTWSATSTTNAPSGRAEHKTVWTGSKMIVWGGVTSTSGTFLNTGSIYDPSNNTWTATSLTNAPTQGRIDHSSVWTGSKMIVWGGYNTSNSYNDGGIYDPTSNTWVSTLASPLLKRSDHSAVWTGSKMILWGGGSRLGDGSQYVP